MASTNSTSSFRLGDRTVKRMGYGAMQLAGPGVFGPSKDPQAALAVLREAVASGVDHIDTSDFYGPHVVNLAIAEALHPYPGDLTIVTKVGARRDDKGAWLTAIEPDALVAQVHGNLRTLRVDALDVVNMRMPGNMETHLPADAPLEPQITALAELQRKGLIKHIGVSHVTPSQLEKARSMVDIVCVQNHYNLVHRADDAMVDALAAAGIPYVPYFPLGGFSPLQSSVLSEVAKELGATPMQTALAWLLQRAPNILLIPGTSSVTHLRENLAAAELALPAAALAKLDAIGTKA